ncbi:MAG TPA: shikimate kinase [Candidatus Sulfotelmatobacter sp.]|nr:shikimate kinase [Candidatus Sulfotelmatobacter sp.]
MRIYVYGGGNVLKTSSNVARKPPNNVVILVGFMGAGKSSVGQVLGQRLNWPFADLDDLIEAQERRLVAEIFRDSGEAGFRRAEHAALKQAIGELRGGGRKIIALGGGAFVQKENAALLQAARVPTVFLDAPVEELWQRCRTQAEANGTERPLLRSREEFRKLYETRRAGYGSATLQIQTGSRSVEAIADEIAEKLGLERTALRTEEGEFE